MNLGYNEGKHTEATKGAGEPIIIFLPKDRMKIIREFEFLFN